MEIGAITVMDTNTPGSTKEIVLGVVVLGVVVTRVVVLGKMSIG